MTHEELLEFEFIEVLKEIDRENNKLMENFKFIVGDKIYNTFEKVVFPDFEDIFFREYTSNIKKYGKFNKQRAMYDGEILKGFKWELVTSNDGGYTGDYYAGYVAYKFNHKYLIFEYRN